MSTFVLAGVGAFQLIRYLTNDFRSSLIGGFIFAARRVYYHRYINVGLLVFSITIVLLMLWWYSREFALKAQNRAIRAEENFRHYILTGKPLDKQLRLGQIIALRFASDDELPGLAKKAVEEKLSSKQIKQSIKSWKADHHRV